MSVWRRNAVKLFPTYRQFLNDKGNSLAQFLLEFSDEFDESLKNRDFRILSKIFGYAEWCLHTCGWEIEEQVIPFFYKDIFLYKQEDWDYILQWISPSVIINMSWYLKVKLDDQLYQKAKQIVETNRKKLYEKVWSDKNA